LPPRSGMTHAGRMGASHHVAAAELGDIGV
jgi:hypothetical protein